MNRYSSVGGQAARTAHYQAAFTNVPPLAATWPGLIADLHSSRPAN